MSDPAQAPRPRAWWVALLLNLLFPPAGYAYVGAWMAVAVTLLVIVTVPILVMVATLEYPPGFYAAGMGPAIWASLAVLAILGLHAALLARRAPGRTGPQLPHGLLYMAPWAAAFAVNLAFNAYWPNPAYAISSEAMQPTLQPGDVLAVEGARNTCKADPKPGDVVLYRAGAAHYLMRVVAGPGQRVMMASGQLFIDGKPVERKVVGATRVMETPLPVEIVEETLADGARYRTIDFGPDGALDTLREVTVPAGAWYVLGDNRDNAADSRVHGPVAARDICAVGLKLLSSKDGTRVGQRP
ncbi:signal peptidase I [Phenylobacterium sp.]|uniref:signal peptidase I n=1 Tax=Phenylobacterium sp. TaxID=1871053 RepID=UPI0025DE817B|nr:signal peptidase I [Phenylobacterium sp.]MBX3483614.1 signal peptidase I [Phenylobacterium sp.]